LRRVEELVECEIVVRGNEIVLRGTEAAVERAEAVFNGLVGLSEEGHHPTPETAERLYKMADGGGGREVLGDVILTHRGRRVAPKTRNQKALYRRHPRAPGRLRYRARGDREDLPRGRPGRPGSQQGRGDQDHPDPSCGRSRGVARLPARGRNGEGDPYFRPLYDALYEMIDPAKFQGHLERGIIEIAPLAFMRGRTLNDAFIILDEAQNTTPQQMKMFLTRLGFGSKMVITATSRRSTCPRAA
jgi:phosphate starvation-inducible PhoH-like protein